MLKLYVWEKVLIDYYDGVMFALAESPEEARRLLLEKCAHLPEEDLAQGPREVTEPEGFYNWGGG